MNVSDATLYESDSLGKISIAYLFRFSIDELLDLFIELRYQNDSKEYVFKSENLCWRDLCQKVRVELYRYYYDKVFFHKRTKYYKRINLPRKKTIKNHRPNTIRGKMIAVMAKPDGADLDTLCKITDHMWTIRQIRITLYLINKDIGHGIIEDENGNFHIVGKLRYKKPLNYPQKPIIRNYRAGTKQAKLIELLKQDGGATMDDIMFGNGWNMKQASESLRLLHIRLGYGLQEDQEGNIYLVE